MGIQRVCVVVALLCICLTEGGAVTFTFVNKCTGTVWPGILSNAGTAPIEPTGFALPPGAARALPFPTGWSGRMWARTGCGLDNTGKFVCATGDCRTGTLECSGRDGATPATLAEFTLDGGGHNDFYDVSLVDGYNLPILVEPAGSSGNTGMTCAAAGCSADLNLRCPAELRSAGGGACRSACDAFGKPEYCCSGAFANPNTCHATAYSQAFKAACPRSYSYAFDDPTSTFTCAGGRDYTITFCPVATPRLVSHAHNPVFAPSSSTKFVSGIPQQPPSASIKHPRHPTHRLHLRSHKFCNAGSRSAAPPLVQDHHADLLVSLLCRDGVRVLDATASESNAAAAGVGLAILHARGNATAETED